MARVFISHSSKDKEFVRQLAGDLTEVGHKPWLDEWEIQVGDCIVHAIGEGLAQADYVVLVLSQNSVESGWVEREWAPSYWDEIQNKRRILLPVMLNDCTIPLLLKTKKYADFRRSYAAGFAQLVNALGPILQSIEPPSGQQLPPRDDDVLSLLTKVQGRSSTLAACLVEGLALASRRGDAALKHFCERELGGYTHTAFAKQTAFAALAKDDPEFPAHRLIEIYVSPSAKINMQYFGWGNSVGGIFDHMAQDKHFTPLSTLITHPVAMLESMPLASAANSLVYHVAKLKDFDPNTEHPETPVHIYSRADAYANVLEVIRGEFTQRLLMLLPSAPNVDGTV
jgi:hypothetical protein